jgi:hypothetical protein
MKPESKNQKKDWERKDDVIKFKYSQLSFLAKRQLDRLLKKLQMERQLVVGSNPEKYVRKIKELLESEGVVA